MSRRRERNASLCLIVCQVSIFTCGRWRENRDHTGRVMVMFLYSSFLQQPVSARYVNRHDGIWVWLNVNAWRKKRVWKEEGKSLFLRIRDVGCSGLCGSLAMQGGHWIGTQHRTAKVVCIPRGSDHDMFVIYSTTVRSRSGSRASLSFCRRWVVRVGDSRGSFTSSVLGI